MYMGKHLNDLNDAYGNFSIDFLSSIDASASNNSFKKNALQTCKPFILMILICTTYLKRGTERQTKSNHFIDDSH